MLEIRVPNCRSKKAVKLIVKSIHLNEDMKLLLTDSDELNSSGFYTHKFALAVKTTHTLELLFPFFVFCALH